MGVMSKIDQERRQIVICLAEFNVIYADIYLETGTKNQFIKEVFSRLNC